MFPLMFTGHLHVQDIARRGNLLRNSHWFPGQAIPTLIESWTLNDGMMAA